MRKRPSVIFGSDSLEGCQHSVFEILSNSIDEAREGHGDRIILTRYLDLSVEVEDFARGIPVDYNEKEGKENWELVFCELFAGGKYNNNSGEGSYQFSLGLNGLGLCATQYASEYMDAEIWKDKTRYTLHFEKGENVGGLTKEPYSRRRTGSRIRWKPDREVFTEIDIPAEHYMEIMKQQAVVNAGITFVLRIEQEGGGFETVEYLYENGITDYLSELVGDAQLTAPRYYEVERRGRDADNRDEYDVRLSVAFCFSAEKSILEYYHNSSALTHGGSPEKAVRQAFTSQIDSYLKSSGKYLKGESRVTFGDIEDCLLLVSSSFSTQTSYENQTKKAINNKFIYEAMTQFLKSHLEIYFIEKPDEASAIADRVLINKRSRENAEKARQTMKKKLSGSIDIANRVQKFVDCRSKDTAIRELYIVEGDSALGSCKLGRDAHFQAIMPVRGKILNCLKSDVNRIFKNDIITDLIKVMGCGVELGTKAKSDLSSFDLDKLRFNKIIICTDADVDGFQIRTLILTMLYRLTPTLIERGMVYIAESPLYEITTRKQTYFAYSDAEKNSIMDNLKGEKASFQRSKGLGENEPDMMWLTTMNPETRRLIRVTPDEAEATSKMFDLLLGDNLSGRKEFIQENGSRYLAMIDA